MTNTTFDVRIWDVRVKTGRPRKDGKPGKKSFVVRWVVAGQEFPKTYATSKQAESFRSKLVVAQSSGEAFRVIDGLPVSMARAENDKPWFTFRAGVCGHEVAPRRREVPVRQRRRTGDGDAGIAGQPPWQAGRRRTAPGHDRLGVQHPPARD
ncbi:hypothetical protein [Amycolatopsis sp. Hca4]|uniref:hypothetical protein n=1 Tax=Amycolatopsis sp. Hca4 TaxID=2742131 RepID=UPI00159085C0|nr:hypothetical protein HUT10_10110 [Amycolatopsis sp. Hca4]